MITSFVETQKFSIAKQMQRVFSKYLTYKRDNNDLLFFVLQQLGREELSYQQARSAEDAGDRIEIEINDFAQKARQLGVFDLTPFYASTQFAESGYEVDEANAALVKAF